MPLVPRFGISAKPVWGQCDKRMLLGALCPVQLGYDIASLFATATRGKLICELQFSCFHDL